MHDDGMELEEEAKFQNYTGIETIGAGKFATVHKAVHIPTGQSVALKKVQIFENISNTTERHEVVREAKLLQRLDHANIIKCYDSWIERGEFYVALELCQDGDLASVIKAHQTAGTRIPVAQVWSYTFQLSEALCHMLERKLMHRDIKPANVFITKEGTLKLGDLGMGRSFSSRTLEATSVVGTPYYMAPEVMNNSPYSYPADVWSLGCVVYELCNLTSPFYERNSSLYQLFNKIKSGTFAPVDSSYGPEMQELVSAMVSQETSHRPTMGQVRAVVAQQLQMLH
jgi:NIMA (never in mitosis gene a)-related kinase